MARSIEIDGVDRVRAALKAAPERVRVEMQQAVRTTSFAIAQRVRAGAPRDTGTLRSAVTSSVRGLSGKVEMGAEAYYWRFIEYGTVRLAARPFVRPAAEQEAPEFVRRVQGVVSQLERDFNAGRFS